MEIPDFSNLKKIRRRIGLSQQELAKQAGVSQSLIAKIESGLLDPTLTNARKITQAIKSFEPKEETAGKVMSKHVVTFQKETPMMEIIGLMRKKGISQIPITDDERVVGLITENTVLEHLENIPTSTAEEIMRSPPPILDKSTPISAVAELLKTFSIVLILEKGELKGHITKSDLMGFAVRKEKPLR